MSPRLRLVAKATRPKSKERVTAICANCKLQRTVVFAELVRTVNNQSKHVVDYHCPSCYRALPSVVAAASLASKSAIDKIVAGSSERSKRLWLDDAYRTKMRDCARRLSSSKEFAEKISAAIKKKFADPEYVARVNAARRNNAAEFLARCSLVHDGFYDYSKTVYVSTDVAFTVVCPHHGPFVQLPSNHVRGHGCPTCAAERSKLTATEFFERCAVVHGGRYDYSDSTYESSLSHIVYKCDIHGHVVQLAQNHLKGAGCRFCDSAKTSSKGEMELAEFVGSLTQCVRNDRNILDGQEIDIVAGNVGIEYHGLYWHSYNRPETREESYRHYNKLDAALDKGFSLIQIYESEWRDKPQIVKSMLRSKLGLVKSRVYARDCVVTEPTEAEMKMFFDHNHLHGHRRSSRYLALEKGGCIVAAASFNNLHGRWELMRFCNLLDTMVVGGLSRLMKRSGLGSVFTYVDRRYSPTAAAYIAAGFVKRGVTPPGYSYCKGQKVYPRQMFQKHKLPGLLPDFKAELTEAQNMFANGYRRLWDAGHYKLELL